MEKYITSNCKTLFNAFRCHGFELYIVGGCIRDSLLGIAPHDIDFATNATVEQMYNVANFLHVLVEIIPTGEKFGTLTFRFLNNGEEYEVTTYRVDGRYEDGRHPTEVHTANTIQEDLSRRDFTCNAIAWNPDTGYVDPFGGVEDVHNNIIKCVGIAEERFMEDALRMIRLVRFSVKYGFEIDVKTLNAAIFNAPLLRNVSKERLGKELTQILALPIHCFYGPEVNILLYHLLKQIIGPDVRYDRISTTSNPLLRWKYMMPDTSEQETTSILNSFAVGKTISQGVRNINRAIDYIVDNIDYESKYSRVLSIVKTDMERRAFLEYIKEWIDITPIVNAIIYDEPYSVEQLDVDGEWVMKVFNLSPGKEVKEKLEEILEKVIEDPYMNNRKKLEYYYKGE